MEFGCGQCLPCKINRKRLWTGRMLLESTQHPSSLFVTLTYDDQHEPENGFLVPKDLQLFLKRLRRNHNDKIRFFAVGEYGETTFRPHYHAALYGSFNTFTDGTGHVQCDAVKDSWKLGHVHVGSLTSASAAYLAKYCLKSRWSIYETDLGGLPPEFTRMSLNPGIGKLAIDKIAKELTESRKSAAYLAAKGDVPDTFRQSGKQYRFGRYLQQKLRQEIGRDEKMPANLKLQLSAKMKQQNPEVRRSVRQQHANIAAAKHRQVKNKVKL